MTLQEEKLHQSVLNLPGALIVAGVPCVVVPQCQLDDESTCQLRRDSI